MSFQRTAWASATNIYEVNLRQYTPEGSFAAFGRHLPRLRDMGIEVLWFMPITPISQDRRKGSLGSYYACSDYMATNPEYGSLDDFKQLVKDAHGMGFKVLIDWVANHTGWDHRWTKEHPDYYRKNQEGQFYEAHGWEDVIDLNYDNPQLRQAMISAMEFWIDQCDLDGFRCDMAMLVPLDFWREARTALDKRKQLFWLAECEEVAYHEVFDATYTWKFLHRMEAVRRKEYGPAGLDEVLQEYAASFPTEALRAYFTSNHDENSHSGSEYERMGDEARLFAVLCCTWNGVPLIYSGQELPNYKRLQFFEKDPIEWKAEQDPAAWKGAFALHDFYKRLLGLRRRNAALQAGRPDSVQRLHTKADDRSFIFRRTNGGDEVLVLLNLSAEVLTIPVQELGLGSGGTFQALFLGGIHQFTEDMLIQLAPWGYEVYERLQGEKR